MNRTPTSVSRFLASAIRPSTLGGRLVGVLALFISIVTVAVVGIQFAQGRAQLTREAEQRLQGEATLVAQRLDRDVRERVRSAAVWSQLEAAQDVLTDDIDKRLASTLQRLVTSLGVEDVGLALDAAGRVIAASRPALIGGRPPAFVPARACDDPERGSSGVLVVQSDDGPTLLVRDVIRARADGRAIGCLLLATPWSALVRDAVALSDRDRLTVTREGTTLWRGALRRTGKPVVAARSVVTGAGLTLDVEMAQSRADALAIVRQRGLAALLLAAIVMLVALPAAFLVARSTTRPLRALTDAALALSDDATGLTAPAVDAPNEVRVLHAALDSMLARLEQSRRAMAEREALASLGGMAAALAHEIRTPLAVVQSSAELLGRETSDERRREMTALVLAEVQRLDRLVTDLLTFARPRAPELRSGDLAQVVRRALPLLEPVLATHHVTMDLALDPAPAVVDDEQVQQVFLNLATNAVQFSPPGSAIRVSTVNRDGLAELTVADQGRGIEPARMAEVWKPFHTTRRGGTGLGLAIVRQIVEHHAGAIAITSAPGAGTTIRVTFPWTARP